VALSVISPRWFWELILDKLLLEEDIVRYRRFSGIVSTLRRWKTDGDLKDEAVEQSTRRLGAEKDAVGKHILSRIITDPFYGEMYRRMVRNLDLSNRAVVPAILLVKLPSYSSIQQ